MAELPHYNIYFDERIKSVVMNWTGYADSKELKEGSEIMLKTLIENKSTKVLANCRDMILISMDDQRWIEHNFIPRAIREGFRRIAMVKPVSYFNKVAVETIYNNTQKRELVEMKIFDTYQEAEKWLSENNG